MNAERIRTLLKKRYPTVTPFKSDFAVYNVWSESQPGTRYRVDLAAHRWNGACSCQNFVWKRAWVAERAEHDDNAISRCKHITMARHYQLDEWALNLELNQERDL